MSPAFPQRHCVVMSDLIRSLPFPDTLAMPDFGAIQLAKVAKDSCGWIGKYVSENNSWTVQFFALFGSCAFLFSDEAPSSQCIDVIYLCGAVFQQAEQESEPYKTCYTVRPQLPRISAGAQQEYTIGFHGALDAAMWLQWHEGATEQYRRAFSHYVARMEEVWRLRPHFAPTSSPAVAQAVPSPAGETPAGEALQADAHAQNVGIMERIGPNVSVEPGTGRFLVDRDRDTECDRYNAQVSILCNDEAAKFLGARDSVDGVALSDTMARSSGPTSPTSASTSSTLSNSLSHPHGPPVTLEEACQRHPNSLMAQLQSKILETRPPSWGTESMTSTRSRDTIRSIRSVLKLPTRRSSNAN